jgi:hypothetical protein
LGEFWKPSNKECSFINRGAMDMTVVSLFFLLIVRETRSLPQGDYDCNGQTHNVTKSGHGPQPSRRHEGRSVQRYSDLDYNFKKFNALCGKGRYLL